MNKVALSADRVGKAVNSARTGAFLEGTKVKALGVSAAIDKLSTNMTSMSSKMETVSLAGSKLGTSFSRTAASINILGNGLNKLSTSAQQAVPAMNSEAIAIERIAVSSRNAAPSLGNMVTTLLASGAKLKGAEVEARLLARAMETVGPAAKTLSAGLRSIKPTSEISSLKTKLVDVRSTLAALSPVSKQVKSDFANMSAGGALSRVRTGAIEAKGSLEALAVTSNKVKAAFVNMVPGGGLSNVKSKIESLDPALQKIVKSANILSQKKLIPDSAGANISNVKTRVTSLNGVLLKSQLLLAKLNGVSSNAFKGLSSAKALKAVADVNNAFSKLGPSAQKASTFVNKAFENIGGGVTRLISKLSGVSGKLSTFTSSVPGLSGIASKLKLIGGAAGGAGAASGILKIAMGNIVAGGILAGFAAISAAVGAIAETAKQAVKEVVGLEASVKAINLQGLGETGAIEAAGNAFKFVSDESFRLGGSLVKQTQSFSKFNAAANLAGASTEDVKKAFTGLSEVSAVLHLSTSANSRAFLALEQMFSKGKVSSEELRRQLCDAIPGAVTIMAESMGVTTQKLDQMLRTGQVGVENIIPFIDKLRSKFSSGLTDALNSPIVAMERLSNSGEQLSLTFGQAFGKTATSSINALASAVKGAGLNVVFEALGIVVGGLVVIINGLGAVLIEIANVFANLFSPVIAVARVAVSGLITVVNALFSVFGGIVSAIGAVLSPFSVLGDLIGTTAEVLRTMYSIIAENVWEVIIAGVKGIINLIPGLQTLLSVVDKIITAFSNFAAKVKTFVGGVIKSLEKMAKTPKEVRAEFIKMQNQLKSIDLKSAFDQGKISAEQYRKQLSTVSPDVEKVAAKVTSLKNAIASAEDKVQEGTLDSSFTLRLMKAELKLATEELATLKAGLDTLPSAMSLPASVVSDFGSESMKKFSKDVNKVGKEAGAAKQDLQRMGGAIAAMSNALDSSGQSFDDYAEAIEKSLARVRKFIEGTRAVIAKLSAKRLQLFEAGQSTEAIDKDIAAANSILDSFENQERTLKINAEINGENAADFNPSADVQNAIGTAGAIAIELTSKFKPSERAKVSAAIDKIMAGKKVNLGFDQARISAAADKVFALIQSKGGKVKGIGKQIASVMSAELKNSEISSPRISSDTASAKTAAENALSTYRNTLEGKTQNVNASLNVQPAIAQADKVNASLGKTVNKDVNITTSTKEAAKEATDELQSAMSQNKLRLPAEFNLDNVAQNVTDLATKLDPISMNASVDPEAANDAFNSIQERFKDKFSIENLEVKDIKIDEATNTVQTKLDGKTYTIPIVPGDGFLTLFQNKLSAIQDAKVKLGLALDPAAVDTIKEEIISQAAVEYGVKLKPENIQQVGDSFQASLNGRKFEFFLQPSDSTFDIKAKGEVEVLKITPEAVNSLASQIREQNLAVAVDIRPKDTYKSDLDAQLGTFDLPVTPKVDIDSLISVIAGIPAQPIKFDIDEQSISGAFDTVSKDAGEKITAKTGEGVIRGVTKAVDQVNLIELEEKDLKVNIIVNDPQGALSGGSGREGGTIGNLPTQQFREGGVPKSLGSFSEGLKNTNVLPKKLAGGGIPVTVHPNEAIVPLSKGRSIPVDIRTPRPSQSNTQTQGTTDNSDNRNINVYIQTQDVNSFSRSKDQILNDMKVGMDRSAAVINN
jgi:tape measure domain-containing protein